MNRIICCPFCDRTITSRQGRYNLHSTIADSGDHCPMSRQRLPITGLTDADYVSRAKLVADLAEQVQDADPAAVWTYLTSLPAVEIQRLLVISLAAIPVDQRLSEMFAWVTALPVAQAVTA